MGAGHRTSRTSSMSVAGAMVAAVSIAACSNRAAPPAARNGLVLDAATVSSNSQVTDARAPEPWTARSDTYAAVLARDAGGSVVLVDEADGLVARKATGEKLNILVPGRVMRAEYDPRNGIVWFVRGGTLEAFDLAAPVAKPIAIVDDMPDIGFDVPPGTRIDQPDCDACVIVAAEPVPAVAVTTEAARSGGQFDEGDANRYERDRAIAEKARPHLAAGADTFLAAITRRRDPMPGQITLGDGTWPLPRAAGDPDPCEKPTTFPRPDCCIGGCRRGFPLSGLGWTLVVAGRYCTCDCDALCVLYDPSTHQFARPSLPERWTSDAKPEAPCALALDASGTAYILGTDRVCTRLGCWRPAGRVLGWITPGPRTGPIPEGCGSIASA